MARTRLIKPGFFLNEDLADMEPIIRLLFIALWTIADSAGRLKDSPRRIQASCLPYDQVNVDSCLSQLQIKGFIHRYVVNNRPFLQIANWRKHQRPHYKEIPSEIPELPENYQQEQIAMYTQSDLDLTSDQVQPNHPHIDPPLTLNPLPLTLNPSKLVTPEKSEPEIEFEPKPKPKPKPEKSPKQKFIKPTLQEVRDYILENDYPVDPEKFFYHYESNGWVQGKNKPVKNWKACVQTWIKNANTYSQDKNNGGSGTKNSNSTRAERHRSRLNEIARLDIEENGFSDSLDSSHIQKV